MSNIDDIKMFAKNMRKTLINMAYHSDYKSHYGGGLSMVDILAVLYKGIMKINPENPQMPDRDRFILSKGHGVLGLYSVLNEAGFIPNELLDTFQTNESELGSHPVKNVKYGIEASNGSLGQGLSMAIGILLAARIKKIDFKVYVLLGDGECNEGSNWEAAMAASHFKLNNLIAIIDNNGLQSDGATEDIMDMGDIKDKWKSFGWNAIDVDGHNIEELYDKIKNLPDNDKPTAFIAKTVKGKGISFMENNAFWHHDKLNEEQYRQAVKEIEEV